jgi:hypothetical protein
MFKPIFSFFSLSLFLLLPLGTAGAQNRPVVGKPAPLFTLPDVDGKSVSLKALRGKPVVVWFFCACEYCKPVAKLWAEARDSDALNAKDSAAKPPVSLIVFAGEADETREFGQINGHANEPLLPDPKLRTALLYNAIPCPRMFVLDAKGVLRYTNNEAGRQPYKIPATTIVSRGIAAVQRVWEGKPAPENRPKPKERPKPAAGSKGDRRAKS